MKRALEFLNEDRVWWAFCILGVAAYILWDFLTNRQIFRDGSFDPWFAIAVPTAVLMAVSGMGILFRQKWARWLGIGLYAWVAVIAVGTLLVRGYSLFLLLSVFGCCYCIWVLWRMKFDGPEVEEEDDKPFLSLVLLLKEPHFLEAPILARLATQAWGIEVDGSTSDGEGGDNDSPTDDNHDDETLQGFVVGDSPLFICKHPQAMLMVHNFDSPYFDDPSDVANDLPELRAKQAVEDHRAWLSADIVVWEGGEDDRAAAYRLIARLLAELADDNCLALVDPDVGRIFVYDPETEAKLRSDDPLKELQQPYYVPVQQIEGDDPRLEAAVAEARRRWPEFVAAFEERDDDDLYSVKASFTDGENTEFMWLSVGSIENDVIYGTLGNDPVNVKGLKDGQPVRTKVEDLNDWMFVAGEEPVGGFTVKVLAEIMRDGQADDD